MTCGPSRLGGPMQKRRKGCCAHAGLHRHLHGQRELDHAAARAGEADPEPLRPKMKSPSPSGCRSAWSVRDQTLHQLERADQNLAQLKREVEAASTTGPAPAWPPRVDSLSGLPLRAKPKTHW